MSELRETVVGKEEIFSGQVVHLQRWDVRLPDGSPATREVILHKGAAAVVAVDDRGRVALVRQFRAPMGEVLLEIPAGKRDTWEEDPLLCARRELREETGLTAETFTHLTDMMTTPGFCSEVISLYLATGLSQGEKELDEDEFLTCEWRDLSWALEEVRSGRVRDAKTALALLLAESALRAP